MASGMPVTNLAFDDKSVKADALAGDDLYPRQPFSIRTTIHDVQIPPHDSQLSAMPSAEEYRVASSSPLILTADPRCTTQIVGGVHNPCTRLPFNVAVPLETELFSGHLVVQVKGLPGTPAAAFRGTKWMGKTVFQGQFKRPIPAQDLWVGQELWNEPLLPESLRRLVFTTAAKFFSSTCKVKVQGEGVGFMNPLLAMSQTVNVSRPGQQPDPTGVVQEDMRLCCSRLVDKQGNPLPGGTRQKHFDKLSTLTTLEFDANNIYTFVILQSFLNLQQYKLSLGGLLSMDLSQILNGQPLQMMCKNIREDKTLLSVLVWHKRLNFPHSSSTVPRGSNTSGIDSSCCSTTAMTRCSSSGISSRMSNGSIRDSSSSSGASDSCSSTDCGSGRRDQDLCCIDYCVDDDDCSSEYASACSRLSRTSSSCSSRDCSGDLEQDLLGCDQQQQQPAGCKGLYCNRPVTVVVSEGTQHNLLQQEQHKKANRTTKAAKYWKQKASCLFGIHKDQQ